MASAATTIPSPARAARSGGLDQCVEFREVGWEGYSELLELRGERGTPRIIYLDGTVFLMSPALPHEWLKMRMGTLVTELSLGLRIRCMPTGQTTFRRGRKRGGVEGDQTYYIANEARVRGKKAIDLEVDPPPDLAIEVVHTHSADRAVEVYRRLEVPEVWVVEEETISFLVLGPDGRYHSSEVSRALPFLRAEEVGRMIHLPVDEDEGEMAWGLALRRWVERELAPRVRG